MLIRSLLFVPGSRPDRFSKALNAGADLICIDLEDAVLPQDKASARESVIDFINDDNNPENKQVCVRINPLTTELGQQDLAALAKVNPAFIMLAKCSHQDEVTQAAEMIGDANSNTHANTQIIGLIETIEGAENAYSIASASSKVSALMFGGADMSAELRCDFTYEPLLHVRSMLVMAAAKAKVDLIDVPFIHLKDEAGLLEETNKIKALGFTAKAAIHPAQISVIHDAFMPTSAQVEYAKSVVDAVEGPDAGVVVVNGRMIDRPIILACQRTLALAKVTSDKE